MARYPATGLRVLGGADRVTLSTYPYLLLTLRAGFNGIDGGLEEASRSLGRSPLITFVRVTLPLLRPALAAGILLVALYVLSDFGAVSMLATTPLPVPSTFSMKTRLTGVTLQRWVDAGRLLQSGPAIRCPTEGPRSHQSFRGRRCPSADILAVRAVAGSLAHDARCDRSARTRRSACHHRHMAPSRFGQRPSPLVRVGPILNATGASLVAAGVVWCRDSGASWLSVSPRNLAPHSSVSATSLRASGHRGGALSRLL